MTKLKTWLIFLFASVCFADRVTTYKITTSWLRIEFDFVVRIIDIDIPDGSTAPFSKSNWVRFYTHNNYYIKKIERESKRKQILLYFGLYKLLNNQCGPSDLEYYSHDRHHQYESNLSVQHLDSYYNTKALNKEVGLNVTTNELIIQEKHQTLYESEHFRTRKSKREIKKLFGQVCKNLTKVRLGTVKICRFFINGLEKGWMTGTSKYVVYPKDNLKDQTNFLEDQNIQKESSRVVLKINSALRKFIYNLNAVKPISQLKIIIGENSIQTIFQNVFDFFSVGHFHISKTFTHNQIDKYYQNYLYRIAILKKQQVKAMIFAILAAFFGFFLAVDFYRARKRDTIRTLKSDASKLFGLLASGFFEGGQRMLETTSNEVKEVLANKTKLASFFAKDLLVRQVSI